MLNYKPTLSSKPKLKFKFCTAAPLAPFPKLSKRAISKHVPFSSLAKTDNSSLFVSRKPSARKNAPRSKSSIWLYSRTETNAESLYQSFKHSCSCFPLLTLAMLS